MSLINIVLANKTLENLKTDKPQHVSYTKAVTNTVHVEDALL